MFFLSGLVALHHVDCNIGLFRDNGKENGKYCMVFRGIIQGYKGIMEKEMETTISTRPLHAALLLGNLALPIRVLGAREQAFPRASALNAKVVGDAST